ncbi:MAG TPA: hypothetical protein VJ385_00780, partial [Fibrobacteria bacterium]|nr:hypothetical protein [Fibrobacteria bacterium]
MLTFRSMGPFAAALPALLCLSAGGAAAPLLELDSVKTLLMDPNGVAPRDISMLPVLNRKDSLRLTRVEAVLREPFRLEEVAAEILSRTAPAAGADSPRSSLPIAPDSLWPLLDVEPSAVPAAPPALAGGPVSKADSGGGFKSAALAAFNPGLALDDIREGLREHTAGLTGAEREFLYRESPALFLQDEEDTTRTPVENEVRRLENDARTHRIMEVAGRLKWAGLTRAAAGAWRLETWLIRCFRSGDEAAALRKLKKAAGEAKAADRFPVHVGTQGADRHTVGEGIWIDPGGDDEYVFSGPGRPGAFTLILDAGGDDLYLSKDSLHLSAGNLGVSVAADLAGADHYLGSNFAHASAEFGFSSLFDAAGHDSYEGRCASLGFGFFGIGVLQDEGGNDAYSASLMSEGAGSTKGAGLLLDRYGEDRYLARPTFKDDLRYSDHYIQMVQGFATGFSPDYPGGIGLLRDGSGNDTYLADIFGQGSGYWYSLGLLIDEAGDDRYSAHQYAQGAGVHIAIGALLDFAGEDRYASKGVSQGCGHDYGFGYLFDKAGADTYLATDMSQGAGSANGLGILQDAAGDDMYVTLNPDMALGHADMRRDRGSFGFFLDRGGKDRYTRPLPRQFRILPGQGRQGQVYPAL